MAMTEKNSTRTTAKKSNDVFLLSI